MRQNYFFALLLLFGFGTMTAQAQKTQGARSQAMFAQGPAAQRVTASQCDTTELGFPIQGTPALYTSQGWGFASGHNDYLDEAKAERFENLTNVTEVYGVRFNFAYGTSSGPTAKVVVNVWNEASGAPGTSLHSEDLLIDDIIAASGDVTINFASPVTVSGPYYIGVELTYAAGDTVALATNTDGETVPSTSWERWSGGTWYPYDDASSWGLEVSSAVYPLVLQANFPVVITPPNPTIVSGTSVNLTATGGSSYTWTPATGLSCTACQNPTASPGQTTTYTVVAMDSTGSCGVTETVTVTVTTVSIDDALFNGQAIAYPNPSTGKFMLTFNQSTIADLDIQITNAVGQVIYTESLNDFTGDYSKALDLSSFASGLYTLRVSDGKDQFIQKLRFF